MPHSAIRKPYQEPQKLPLVSHDRFHRDRRSGTLDLTLVATRSHPLVLGAGWLDAQVEEVVIDRGGLKKIGKKRIRIPPQIREELQVASEIVGRATDGVPVIPGSALKGAVRQVYELLTPSCQPGASGACSVEKTEQSPTACPACSLFGTPGFAGRARFREASPPAPGAARTDRVVVPIGWSHKQPRNEGTYRFYRTSKDPLRKEDETTWAAWGTFCSRLTVTNVTDDELGLLMASLGIGWTEGGPSLRVGGKKYHGFGGVQVTPSQWNQAHPTRERLSGEVLSTWMQGLVEAALAQDRLREATWRELHRVLASTEVPE